MSDPVQHVVAWLALALWIAYAVAAHRELGERGGSPGLKALNSIAAAAILGALVWEGWPS